LLPGKERIGALINVLMVADGRLLEMSAYFHICLSAAVDTDFRYFIAVPDDYTLTLDWAPLQKKKHIEHYRIPAPDLIVKDEPYRIVNKIHATRLSPVPEALFCDSDTFFAKPPSAAFLFRGVPCAAPEHNPLAIEAVSEMWQRLYDYFELPQPAIEVMTASGRYCEPYFNAGCIASSDMNALGACWYEIATKVKRLGWVRRKYPYLDQISLSVAMAKQTPGGRCDHNNVLPGAYNFNLHVYYELDHFPRDQVLYHYHYRLHIVRMIFPKLFLTTLRDFDEIGDMLPDLAYEEAVKEAIHRRTAP